MKPSDREQKQFEQVKKIPRDPVKRAETWRKIEEEAGTGRMEAAKEPPFYKRYWPGFLVPAFALMLFVVVLPFIGTDTDEGADAPPASDEAAPETRGLPDEDPEEAIPFETEEDVSAERLMTWADAPEAVDVELVIGDTALFLTALGGVPDDEQDRVITAVLAALEDEGRMEEALNQIRESTHPAAETFLEASEEAEQ